MPRPKRSEQFDSAEICIVHAVQRCVRRAFLAGVDEKTGKDYSFRKEWIRRRLESLASVFGIDVLTYAIITANPPTEIANASAKTFSRFSTHCFRSCAPSAIKNAARTQREIQ